MMETVITCPHCGRRFVHEGEYERVDINGEPHYFLPPRSLDDERHIDQRICCESCYAAHGQYRRAGAVVNQADPPHPFGTRFHREVRLARPVGTKI